MCFRRPRKWSEERHLVGQHDERRGRRRDGDDDLVRLDDDRSHVDDRHGRHLDDQRTDGRRRKRRIGDHRQLGIGGSHGRQRPHRKRRQRRRGRQRWSGYGRQGRVRRQRGRGWQRRRGRQRRFRYGLHAVLDATRHDSAGSQERAADRPLHRPGRSDRRRSRRARRSLRDQPQDGQRRRCRRWDGAAREFRARQRRASGQQRAGTPVDGPASELRAKPALLSLLHGRGRRRDDHRRIQAHVEDRLDADAEHLQPRARRRRLHVRQLLPQRRFC